MVDVSKYFSSEASQIVSMRCGNEFNIYFLTNITVKMYCKLSETAIASPLKELIRSEVCRGFNDNLKLTKKRITALNAIHEKPK